MLPSPRYIRTMALPIVRQVIDRTCSFSMHIYHDTITQTDHLTLLFTQVSWVFLLFFFSFLNNLIL